MLSAKCEPQAFFRTNLVRKNSFRTAIGNKGKDIIMGQNVKGLKLFCKKQEIAKEKSTSIPFIYFDMFKLGVLKITQQQKVEKEKKGWKTNQEKMEEHWGAIKKA